MDFQKFAQLFGFPKPLDFCFGFQKIIGVPALEFKLQQKIMDPALIRAVAFVLLQRRRRRIRLLKKRHRRWYVRPLNQNRDQDSEYFRLIRPMRVIDKEYHHAYFRISRDRFDDLLKKVEPLITHAPTHRMPIGPGMRLALTLR